VAVEKQILVEEPQFATNTGLPGDSESIGASPQNTDAAEFQVLKILIGHNIRTEFGEA